MKIEIGKTYSVTNATKRTFIEVNYMTGPGKAKFPNLSRVMTWRGGTMIVNVKYEPEVDLLQAAVDAGESYDDLLEFDMFEEAYLDSTWSGDIEDYEAGDAKDLKKVDKLREEYFNNPGDSFDFITWLEEEKGYEMDDTSWSIDGPVEISLIEE